LKPDLYTKLILTFIACVLTWIAVSVSSGPHVVRAQGPYRMVRIGLLEQNGVQAALEELARTQGRVVGFACSSEYKCHVLMQP